MNAEEIARQLAGVSSANTQTGVFVRMDGRFAVVNIGESTVTIPCLGFYPPVPGMPVLIQWVNGSPAVVGPVHPLNPIGQITGTGTPRATVTVDGVAYSLYYRNGYTPSVGHLVEINWATGIIQGQVTGVEDPDAPDESEGGGGSFDVTVRAVNSGRYDFNFSNWWGNDPWASNSNQGVWVYGNRVRDAVGSGTVTGVSIFLPLIEQRGNASIGVHPHAGIPGGAPTITSLTGLSSRNGWVALPVSFGTYVAAGGRGIGVSAPGGGYNRWRGTVSDGMSGALRLTGTR